MYYVTIAIYGNAPVVTVCNDLEGAKAWAKGIYTSIVPNKASIYTINKQIMDDTICGLSETLSVTQTHGIVSAFVKTNGTLVMSKTRDELLSEVKA